jgi:hypothetical protein
MTKGKPFGYLDGMVAEADAPLQDNPARLYCPKCRSEDRVVCDDPAYCGQMRPMRPLPTPPDAFETAPAPNPPSTPRRGSKELEKPNRSTFKTKDDRQYRPLALDASRGARQLQDDHPARHMIVPELTERIMGRRTELKQLADGQEQSWDWFMEQVKPEGWSDDAEVH